jgi:hypothetical protein
VVVALVTIWQGALLCTQCMRVELHVQRPAHSFVSRRSHTELPEVQGRVDTQFITGSQNSPFGQALSWGVWTQALVLVLHESAVHGTPSSQFWGLPVGMQRPPRHSKPPVVQMLGPVQSSLCTHVCASAGIIIDVSPDDPESVMGVTPESCLVLESPDVASVDVPPSLPPPPPSSPANPEVELPPPAHP